MSKKQNPYTRLLVGVLLVAAGINIDNVITGFISDILAAGLTIGGLLQILIAIYAIIRDLITGSKGGIRRTAESNAAVIRDMYHQMLADDNEPDEKIFPKLCYMVLQDEEYAHAALNFAKEQAESQNEELSLHRVAYAILVAQMHISKGSEPNKNQKLIAYTAVREVIGWPGR